MRALAWASLSLLAAQPLIAGENTVVIERIQTTVFPGEGKAAAQAICTGLAAGQLSRDGVGEDLAELQAALIQSNDPELMNQYVDTFNNTAAGQADCNIRITDPRNTQRDVY